MQCDVNAAQAQVSVKPTECRTRMSCYVCVGASKIKSWETEIKRSEDNPCSLSQCRSCEIRPWFKTSGLNKQSGRSCRYFGRQCKRQSIDRYAVESEMSCDAAATHPEGLSGPPPRSPRPRPLRLPPWSLGFTAAGNAPTRDDTHEESFTESQTEEEPGEPGGCFLVTCAMRREAGSSSDSRAHKGSPQERIRSGKKTRNRQPSGRVKTCGHACRAAGENFGGFA